MSFFNLFEFISFLQNNIGISKMYKISNKALKTAGIIFGFVYENASL